MSTITSAIKAFGKTSCNIYIGVCIVAGTVIMLKGAYDIITKQKIRHLNKIISDHTNLSEEDVQKIQNDYNVHTEDDKVILTRKEETI